MRIFGISLTTLFLVFVLVYIVRKWGSSIPVVNSIG